MILSKKKKIILLLLGLGALTAIPFLIKNINKKSIPKKLNFSSTATLKGSKISDGFKGKFFQDKFKNFWAMGFDSKLEVLKVKPDKSGYVNTGWTSDNSGLTKNSNITKGQYGTIFQDKFKNLWAMGNESKLQVLKVNSSGNGYVDSGWINDNTKNGDKLLKNSNITNGYYGTIFQDDFGNLWTLGHDQKLQVLRVNSQKDGYVQEGWIENNTSSGNPLLKNSNISVDEGGTIFQDKFKNLWAMGKFTKLQVLKVNKDGDGYVQEGWIEDNNQDGEILLRNSNVSDGKYGTIFQDKFKNLWVLGSESKLQVLKVNSSGNGYVDSGWIEDNSESGDKLLKNSNIGSIYGTIFQDKFKNLWTIGKSSKLQVLKANPNDDGYLSIGWIENNSQDGEILLRNSNIKNGSNGIIFQDKFKNLWTIAKDSKLQVLKVNQDGNGYVKMGWINDNTKNGDKLLKNSNITNGWNGTIFQDEFKNLWAMSNETKLQVLKANEDGNGYVESWES